MTIEARVTGTPLVVLKSNKALVRRLVEEFLNKSDAAVADELWHPDYRWRPVSGEAEPMDRDTHKRDYDVDLRSIFPDLIKTVEEQAAEGDFVATRCTMQGTQRGEMKTPMGVIPPSGKVVRWTTLSMHRILDGKIREGWIAYDPLDMLQQLGYIPAWRDPLYHAWRPRVPTQSSELRPRSWPRDVAGRGPESNKALVRRLVEEFLNKSDAAVADELWHPDYAFHPAAASETEDRGMDLRTIFPDLSFRIEGQVAEGDLVATRFSVSGTHSGSLPAPMGLIPPTGRPVTWQGLSLHRFRDGAIVQDWIVYDPIRILQQVGDAPAWPAGPGSARPQHQ